MLRMHSKEKVVSFTNIGHISFDACQSGFILEDDGAVGMLVDNLDSIIIKGTFKPILIESNSSWVNGGVLIIDNGGLGQDGIYNEGNFQNMVNAKISISSVANFAKNGYHGLDGSLLNNFGLIETTDISSSLILDNNGSVTNAGTIDFTRGGMESGMQVVLSMKIY